MKIEETKLSKRAKNTLAVLEVENESDFLKITFPDIMRVRGCNTVTYFEIIKYITDSNIRTACSEN